MLLRLLRCRSSWCGSGSVAVDAEAEEVAELSPSGVVVSTRSREGGVPSACVSVSAVV
jgi:hypothetical protein